MEAKEFQPKAFYRKFDSLLAQIGKASAKDLNIMVLEELTQGFGADLKIRSGCLYRAKGGVYHKVKGPVGGQNDDWPVSFMKSNEAVLLLLQHKSYIFGDTSLPPWGGNSVAVVLGEESQFLMAFKLDLGWERELLELSLNINNRSICPPPWPAPRHRKGWLHAYIQPNPTNHGKNGVFPAVHW